MQGDTKVLELRNLQLKNELTAINRHFLHYRMLKHWGFARMAEHEHDESIEEMKHAGQLMDRILMLDGLPNLRELGKLLNGENPVEILHCSLKVETGSQQVLKEGIAHRESVHHCVSRDVLQHILDDAGEPIDRLEPGSARWPRPVSPTGCRPGWATGAVEPADLRRRSARPCSWVRFANTTYSHYSS